MTPLTFVRGVGSVAMRYGLEESIFLDSIIFWVRENRSRNENYHDGRWWTYNSLHGLTEMFPWWSDKQIRRIVNSCKEKGAILTGNYNVDGRDRTIWYSPSNDLLELYGEDWGDHAPESICPNGKKHSPKRADVCAQMGGPLPCNNPCNNIYSPPNPPRGVKVEQEPSKHKHGSYGWVLLTDDQYKKLVSDLGQVETDRCICYVDESAQSSGNKNHWKDWNLVIRRCARDGWGKKPIRRKEKTQPAQPRKNDLDFIPN